MSASANLALPRDFVCSRGLFVCLFFFAESLTTCGVSYHIDLAQYYYRVQDCTIIDATVHSPSIAIFGRRHIFVRLVALESLPSHLESGTRGTVWSL